MIAALFSQAASQPSSLQQQPSLPPLPPPTSPLGVAAIDMPRPSINLSVAAAAATAAASADPAAAPSAPAASSAAPGVLSLLVDALDRPDEVNLADLALRRSVTPGPPASRKRSASRSRHARSSSRHAAALATAESSPSHRPSLDFTDRPKLTNPPLRSTTSSSNLRDRPAPATLAAAAPAAENDDVVDSPPPSARTSRRTRFRLSLPPAAPSPTPQEPDSPTASPPPPTVRPGSPAYDPDTEVDLADLRAAAVTARQKAQISRRSSSRLRWAATVSMSPPQPPPPPTAPPRLIAVGIDGSRHAELALSWALANLFRRDRDRILLIHVRPPVPLAWAASLADLSHRERVNSHRLLRRMAARVPVPPPPPRPQDDDDGIDESASRARGGGSTADRRSRSRNPVAALFSPFAASLSISLSPDSRSPSSSSSSSHHHHHHHHHRDRRLTESHSRARGTTSSSPASPAVPSHPTCRAVSLTGNPAGLAIAALVSRERPDVLVLGTRGTDPAVAARSRIGSCSDYLVAALEIPVVVVKNQSRY
ncbi:hypothetical protein HK405_002903 [Cladochytrium tenue]|nr:hypothetical protein HK405_002903 [Cladochytrium tenue]